MPGPTGRQLSSREAFDAQLLYDALNAERARRGPNGTPISWRELAVQARLRTNGIGRELAAGRLPTAGTLAKLLLWLGATDIAAFIRADYAEQFADAATAQRVRTAQARSTQARSAQARSTQDHRRAS